MAYADITLTEAENLLAVLLADPAKVRFISDELQTYIIEAIRTWGALSGIYEAQTEPIALSPGDTFLDLPTIAPDFCAYTVLPADLVGPMQYHLVEPKNVVVWAGSEMFTLADLTTAITRRRDQFLLDTLCRIDRAQLPASPDTIAPGTESFALPDTTIGVRRAAWVSATGSTRRMWRSSHWSSRSSAPAITGTQGLPRTYDFDTHAPITLSFNPVPADIGTLDLLLIRSGNVGNYLGVPDDFAAFVKWGALADLLGKDGPARDYARSLYCERRYRLGVAAMLARQNVTDVLVNDRPAKFTTIDKLDSGRQPWQDLSAAIPLYAAPVGANLLVLADPLSATADLKIRVQRNAPVPTLGDGGAYLQIGREFLDVILGYAVHLAMFKIGGSEFAATTQFANAMFDAAAEYNAKLKDSAAFEDVRFSDSPKRELKRGVRRVTGATVGGSAEQESA